MKKVTSLKEVAKFSKIVKIEGKKVGLVVGSFDIIHLGHIHLFRFAKGYADVLIVGLDNDQTIRLVKGKNRPVNNFKRRSELLSELSSVDRIFEIKTISHHDSEKALISYKKLIDKILPTHIFTHKVCDNHWAEKKKIAEKMRIDFLLDKSRKVTNSGTIVKLLASEL